MKPIIVLAALVAGIYLHMESVEGKSYSYKKNPMGSILYENTKKNPMGVITYID